MEGLMGITDSGVKIYFDDDWEEYIMALLSGKDIARWHTLLWPAMLKSAGYKLPDIVYVHGFINLEGEKISKSRGSLL